jgi:aspartyl-tRNA synthetase
MFRTFTCGELTDKNVGEEVVLSGWVHRRRDHGGVIFIDLRDRYGLTQIVSDPVNFKEVHELMDGARPEYVLKIKGKVGLRPGNNANTNMPTGMIEVLVTEAEILNESLTPPFEIDQDKDVSEELRLKYRYLDLRRDRLSSNIVLRHHIIKHIRDYLDGEKFIEVETPILIKGTPEGSREYLVPSRLHEGEFYVLPQSPQQLKQLLMVAGFDRYFQIARCFRDEDQRGDRQPEFTQLDMEMSFVEEEEVMAINEGMLIEITKKFAPGKKIMSEPFPVLTYDEAMNIYGSDSPDLRFDLPLSDVSDIASECGFGVFKSAVDDDGSVKALRVPGGADFTRKEIDGYCDMAKVFGAKGLAYIVVADELKSPIVKFFEQAELDSLIERVGAEKGDIIFFCADSFRTACDTLGRLRVELAKNLDLIDPNLFAYCWVKDFPMFEKDEETGSLAAVHHPFTSPKSLKELEETPETSIAKAYDVVLNGVEIGGGSIRIHEEKMQKRIFDILGISGEDADRRFGHMLNAFKYGAPPHGGIAWGLDRLVMIFADEPNIREVIAFPKDQKARDLMLGAPSPMPDDQIGELHIKIDKKKSD